MDNRASDSSIPIPDDQLTRLLRLLFAEDEAPPVHA